MFKQWFFFIYLLNTSSVYLTIVILTLLSDCQKKPDGSLTGVDLRLIGPQVGLLHALLCLKWKNERFWWIKLNTFVFIVGTTRHVKDYFWLATQIMCVRERKRERERERESEREWERESECERERQRERVCVCVCVCVCVRERERVRESQSVCVCVCTICMRVYAF